MTIILNSPLDVEECIERLGAEIEAESFGADLNPLAFLAADRRPIIGRIRGHEFRLRKRRAYQNSFESVFFGTLAPATAHRGTTVQGHFSMHLLVRIFLGVWFGMLLLLFAPVALAQGGGAAAATVLGMLAFGLLLVGFGRLLARREEEYLVEFMRRTLDATIVAC